MKKETYFTFPSELFSGSKLFFSGNQTEFEKWIKRVGISSQKQLSLIPQRENLIFKKQGRSHQLCVIVLSTPTGIPRELILIYQVYKLQGSLTYRCISVSDFYPASAYTIGIVGGSVVFNDENSKNRLFEIKIDYSLTFDYLFK